MDELLRELHDRINEDSPWIDRETGVLAETSTVIGSIAREAIYYGADGFYLHQFRDLARHRFRNDQGMDAAECRHLHSADCGDCDLYR